MVVVAAGVVHVVVGARTPETVGVEGNCCAALARCDAALAERSAAAARLAAATESGVAVLAGFACTELMVACSVQLAAAVKKQAKPAACQGLGRAADGELLDMAESELVKRRRGAGGPVGAILARTEKWTLQLHRVPLVSHRLPLPALEGLANRQHVCQDAMRRGMLHAVQC